MENLHTQNSPCQVDAPLTVACFPPGPPQVSPALGGGLKGPRRPPGRLTVRRSLFAGGTRPFSRCGSESSQSPPGMLSCLRFRLGIFPRSTNSLNDCPSHTCHRFVSEFMKNVDLQRHDIMKSRRGNHVSRPPLGAGPSAKELLPKDLINTPITGRAGGGQ